MSDDLTPCAECGCAKEMHTTEWCWSVRCVGKHRFHPVKAWLAANLASSIDDILAAESAR